MTDIETACRKIIEHYGFRHVGEWGFDDASGMISRIAAGGWRGVPAGVDPATYKPEGVI